MAPQIAELFSRAGSARELTRAVQEVASHLGASSFAFTRFVSTGHGSSVDSLHELPRGYLASFEGHDFPNERDPVMQHLRQTSSPIVWDRRTYVSSGEGAMFGPMGDFGVRSGVALALHLEEGRHFVVGFNWNDDCVPHALTALATLQMCAIFAEPAFYRVWRGLESAELPGAGELTLRELECLYWIGRGHTNKTAAILLGLAPKTVEWHIQSATRKLGASTRTEAAVLATRLRLLEPLHFRFGRRRSMAS